MPNACCVEAQLSCSAQQTICSFRVKPRVFKVVESKLDGWRPFSNRPGQSIRASCLRLVPCHRTIWNANYDAHEEEVYVGLEVQQCSAQSAIPRWLGFGPHAGTAQIKTLGAFCGRVLVGCCDSHERLSSGPGSDRKTGCTDTWSVAESNSRRGSSTTPTTASGRNG